MARGYPTVPRGATAAADGPARRGGRDPPRPPGGQVLDHRLDAGPNALPVSLGTLVPPVGVRAFDTDLLHVAEIAAPLADELAPPVVDHPHPEPEEAGALRSPETRPPGPPGRRTRPRGGRGAPPRGPPWRPRGGGRYSGPAP